MQFLSTTNIGSNKDNTDPNLVFDFNYFNKLDDNIAVLFYVINYQRLNPFENDKFSIICNKIFKTDVEQENILLALLEFLSKNKFAENVNFSIVFNCYLVDLDISSLLIITIAKLIIKSKNSEPYDHFINYLMNETNFIYEDCFWALCLFFRKYENTLISNALYDIGILDVIDKLFSEYELENIQLSTIELIFKVLLSIITNENILFIQENFVNFINAAIFFKDNFLESVLLILLLDENSLDFDEYSFY